MTSAASPTVRDPQQCFDGLAEVMRRLAVDMDVTVEYATLPEDTVVDFDDGTRVLKLRTTATLHQQLYGLIQIWWLLTVGPWAAAAVRKQRHLYLIPQPREASA